MISELLLQIVDPCCALNHQFDRIWNRRKVVPNTVNWPRCPLVPNWIREFRSWISVQRWLGNTIPTGCRSATAPMLRTAVMSSNWGMGALPVLCGNKKRKCSIQCRLQRHNERIPFSSRCYCPVILRCRHVPQYWCADVLTVCRIRRNTMQSSRWM